VKPSDRAQCSASIQSGAGGGSTSNRRSCGLLMPIALTDGRDERHWREVRSILSEAVAAAGFQPSLVSKADDGALVRQQTVQDLYRAAIVVCDVSGKSPNVMFELGMRLAFDKPTLVVQDDATSCSFEGVPLEHLTYPRDLRYAQILEFKQELARKLGAVHRSAQADVRHQTFLEQFGAFTVVHLREREVPRDGFLFEELRELKTMLRLMRQNPRGVAAQNAGRAGHIVAKAMEFIARYVAQHGISSAELAQRKPEVARALEQRLFPQGHFDSLEEWTEFCDILFAALPAKSHGDITLRCPPNARRE